MARQITEIMTRAFMNDNEKNLSNTSVQVKDGYTKMYLFGNLIARKEIATGKIEVTMAGYGTPTTRERLNGLPNCSISQRNYIQYLNGKEIDTDAWYCIN